MPRLSPVLLLAVSACNPTDGGDVAVPEGLVETEGGLYTMRLAPDPDPFVAGEDAVLGIELYAPDGATAVAGAEIAVTPWMTDMAHGITDAPVVTEVGEGLYEAAFRFSMAGYWELTIDVSADAGEDSVVVAYEVE
jgi:hypothetical protein